MSFINTNDLCTGCNKCIRNCPVFPSNHAVEAGMVDVEENACIDCGECIDVCGHGARVYEDDTEKFFEDLKKGEKITVVIAPAFIANSALSMRLNFPHVPKTAWAATRIGKTQQTD